MNKQRNKQLLTYKERCVKKLEPIHCCLCSSVIKRSDYLKKHLINKHKFFLKYRSTQENISLEKALDNTLINHLKIGDKIPEELISSFASSGDNVVWLSDLANVREQTGQFGLEGTNSYKIPVKSRTDVDANIGPTTFQATMGAPPATRSDSVGSVNPVKKSVRMKKKELSRLILLKTKEPGKYRCTDAKKDKMENKPAAMEAMKNKGTDEYITAVEKTKENDLLVNKTCTTKIKKKENLSSKCSENLRLLGMFMACNNLDSRFLPRFAQLLDIMMTNTPSNSKKILHPFGNCSHTVSSARASQIACYEACKEEMKQENERLFLPTGLTHRFMVNTAAESFCNDVMREVIVLTKIDETGEPKEHVLSCAPLRDRTVEGIYQHIVQELSGFMNIMDVAVACINDASCHGKSFHNLTYHGSDFSKKVHHLFDVCYKMKLLIFHDVPDWVVETIEATRDLVNEVYQIPIICQKVKTNENNRRFNIVDVPSVSDSCHGLLKTNYQFCFILRNVELLLKHLPDIINNNDIDGLTKKRASKLLSKIQDRVFLAQVMLINKLFSDIRQLCKLPCHATFGPFELVNVINQLKSRLCFRQFEECNEITKFLETGLWTYHNYREQTVIDLSGYSFHLQFKIYIDNSGGFIEPYRIWLGEILERFDEYLGVSDIVMLATEVFSQSSDLTMNERVSGFRKFFSMINTDFDSCEKEGCSIDCVCIETQFNVFWTHMKSILGKEEYMRLETGENENSEDALESKEIRGNIEDGIETEENNLTNENDLEVWDSGKNNQYCIEDEYYFVNIQDIPVSWYRKTFAFYLAEKNIDVVRRLGIRNIVRALEVVQLLKASQAATCRVMNHVDKIIRGRSQSDQFQKNSPYDMVNIITVLSKNTSVLINTAAPRKNYLDAGHVDVLQKMNLVFSTSPTVTGMSGDTHMPGPKCKRKNMVMSNETIELNSKRKPDVMNEEEQWKDLKRAKAGEVKRHDIYEQATKPAEEEEEDEAVRESSEEDFENVHKESEVIKEYGNLEFVLVQTEEDNVDFNEEIQEEMKVCETAQVKVTKDVIINEECEESDPIEVEVKEDVFKEEFEERDPYEVDVKEDVIKEEFEESDPYEVDVKEDVIKEEFEESDPIEVEGKEDKITEVFVESDPHEVEVKEDIIKEEFEESYPSEIEVNDVIKEDFEENGAILQTEDDEAVQEDKKESEEIGEDSDSELCLSCGKHAEPCPSCVYCSCKGLYDYEFWIQCDNRKKCVSYNSRLKEMNVEGGDWFHNECVNVEGSGEDINFFCPLCKKEEYKRYVRNCALRKRKYRRRKGNIQK